MAANIVRDLTSADVVGETAQRLSGMVAMMRDLVPPAAPNVPSGTAGKGK